MNQSFKVEQFFDCEKLRRLRESSNLNLTQWAKEIGVSRQLLNSYEDGMSQPKIRILLRVANKYHLPVSYFFGYRLVSILSKEGGE